MAALPNGEVTDANASKPVRLWAEEEVEVDAAEVSLSFEANAPNGDVLLDADANGELDDCDAAAAHDDEEDGFDPKRLCPFTDANGELVDAYAMKPL